MNTKLEEFNRMGMNLFLSLSLQAVLQEKWAADEKILEDWMMEQVCSTAETLFPIAAEA